MFLFVFEDNPDLELSEPELSAVLLAVESTANNKGNISN